MSLSGIAAIVAALQRKDALSPKEVSRVLSTIVPRHGPNGALFRDLLPDLEYASPGGVLTLFVSKVPRFWEELQILAGADALLGLILYSDVATGGNVLEPRKTREGELIWWSYKEFGPELLAREVTL